MIKNPQHTKSLSFQFEHSSNPKVTTVQIFSDCDSVVVAYCSDGGAVLDADWFSKTQNPELQDIVKEMPHDDVWNLDMVLSLVEPVDSNEVPEMEPLVPAYLQSLMAAS